MRLRHRDCHWQWGFLLGMELNQFRCIIVKVLLELLFKYKVDCGTVLAAPVYAKWWCSKSSPATSPVIPVSFGSARMRSVIKSCSVFLA